MWTNAYSYEDIGEFLREARRARGITQVEMARKLGFSSVTLSALETGKNVSAIKVDRYLQQLGTGGLVRAYTQSTQAGIDAAQLVVVSRCVDLRIRIAYPRYEQLMRLAEDHGAKVLSTDFADAVTMNLRMLDGTQQPLLEVLTALERGQEDVEISDPIDAAF